MIAIITESQKNTLLGQKYDGVQFFNPVQDVNGNWVISEEEVLNSSLEWLKALPLVNFDAPITENLH
jgi:hypothetical protein